MAKPLTQQLFGEIGHSEEFKFGLWKCDSSGSKSKANERQKKFNDDDLPRQRRRAGLEAFGLPPPGRSRTAPKWALAVVVEKIHHK